MSETSPQNNSHYVASLASLPGIEHLSAPELDRLEQAFRTRAERAGRPEHKVSRLRLWLLFILLRHAALRLGEALALNDETDIDLSGGLVHVRGQHARSIPLPHALIPVLRRFFSQAQLSSLRGTLCGLDPGFVRRNAVGLGSLFNINFHLLHFRAAELHQENVAETLRHLRQGTKGQ